MITELKNFFGVFYLEFLRLTILKRRNVFLHKTVKFTTHTEFGGFNKIGKRSEIENSVIGYGTYISNNSKLSDCLIGSYCSIAHNIEVVPFRHPTSIFVSTHPSFYSLLKQAGFSHVKMQLFKEAIFVDQNEKYYVKIGSDVWIGANVIINGGVEIGDGAIIAAGSIVTKNVMPYEIVGGVPAKHIRMRFNENQISFLLDLKWWQKPVSWIECYSYLFSDIEMLRTKIIDNIKDVKY